MKITNYEFGKITIDGKTYSSDVIIVPDKVSDSWWRQEGHSLHINDLDSILAANPELLIIGTGYYGRMQVPDKTKHYLQQQGIEVRQANTGAAVSEFNQLQRSNSRIVAALHLTC